MEEFRLFIDSKEHQGTPINYKVTLPYRLNEIFSVKLTEAYFTHTNKLAPLTARLIIRELDNRKFIGMSGACFSLIKKNTQNGISVYKATDNTIHYTNPIYIDTLTIQILDYEGNGVPNLANTQLFFVVNKNAIFMSQ